MISLVESCGSVFKASAQSARWELRILPEIFHSSTRVFLSTRSIRNMAIPRLFECFSFQLCANARENPQTMCKATVIMDNRVPGGGDGAAWQDALRWGHFDLRRYFTTLIQNFSNRRLPLVNFLGNRNFQFLHARPQRGAVEPQYCGRSFGAADDAVGHPNTTLLPLSKPRIILVFLARLDLYYFQYCFSDY
jgi:hypothetical protein